MIQGRVEDMQARVKVLFRLSDRPDVEIEFVVDTGFAGALTLPPFAVSALGLPYLQEMVANLANDENVRTDVHLATIDWDGQARDVAVFAMGKRPLLGTALLSGSELSVLFLENGLVTIEAS